MYAACGSNCRQAGDVFAGGADCLSVVHHRAMEIIVDMVSGQSFGALRIVCKICTIWMVQPKETQFMSISDSEISVL